MPTIITSLCELLGKGRNRNEKIATYKGAMTVFSHCQETVLANLRPVTVMMTQWGEGANSPTQEFAGEMRQFLVSLKVGEGWRWDGMGWEGMRCDLMR